MRRRIILALGAGVIAAPLKSFAQLPRKIPLVGFLIPGLPPPSPPNLVTIGFQQGLRDMGYVEGRNITVEYRYGGGKPASMPGLALELVKLKVDVLVAVAGASMNAVKSIAGAIPIVATDLETDPVASGLVASLAKPGGSITGLFLEFEGLMGKWFELLIEAAPGIRRVATLWDTTTGRFQFDALAAMAKKLSITLDVVKFQQATEVVAALNASLKQQPQALVQLSSPIVAQMEPEIAQFTQAHRLPAISLFAQFPESGGLMSYGPDLAVYFQRIVPLVDKILKGARPGDIPIERPTTFELVVNAKTAKALGLKIPQSLLLRATRVIE